MRAVGFGEFYNGVKGRLTDAQLRLMNGRDYCFESGGTFLAISIHGNTIWVAWVVGHGVQYMHELKKAAHAQGYRFIAFITKADNAAVNAIAKYWKATASRARDGIVYKIDVKARS